MNDELLNISLDLAMEWGENWLKPIHSRLKKLYPNLSLSERNSYNKIAQESMKFGHSLAKDYIKVYYNHPNKTIAVENDLKSNFESKMKIKYPWINDSNLSRVFSQGCYYAMK